MTVLPIQSRQSDWNVYFNLTLPIHDKKLFCTTQRRMTLVKETGRTSPNHCWIFNTHFS